VLFILPNFIGKNVVYGKLKTLKNINKFLSKITQTIKCLSSFICSRKIGKHIHG